MTTFCSVSHPLSLSFLPLNNTVICKLQSQKKNTVVNITNVDDDDFISFSYIFSIIKLHVDDDDDDDDGHDYLKSILFYHFFSHFHFYNRKFFFH